MQQQRIALKMGSLAFGTKMVPGSVDECSADLRGGQLQNLRTVP
jgi:hypothetical protein